MLQLLKIAPQCERVPRESDIVMAGWESGHDVTMSICVDGHS